jgi:anaerobic ribonucleoside-triphosphate reductase activating protein
MTPHPVAARHGDTVRIAHVENGTDVLGPGRRAVVYAQGCHLRCRGCIAADWLDLEGGEDVPVALLARTLLDAGARALTLSGGEPTLQPAGLVALIDLLAAEIDDLSVMMYTGYRYEYLLRTATVEQRALLARVDLLVDSPYVERWHGDLRWRGSANQRLLRLTDRHTDDELLPDESVGGELVVDADLRSHLIGVPHRPAGR